MKILFLGNQNVFGKIDSGGLQCAARNYSLLQAIKDNNEMYVGIVWNMPVPDSVENVRVFRRVKSNIESLCASFFLCKTYSWREEKRIIQYIEEIKPDILFLDTSIMGKILCHVSPKTKKIVFFHNIESDYAKHKVKEEGMKYLPSYVASAYNEKKAVKLADELICLNKRDAEGIFKKYGRKVNFLLPISFRDRFNMDSVKREPDDKRLLFVGSLFPPNYKGVLWFVEQVMPRLQDFELVIVGKGFEQKKRELETKNVTVIGTVDNLEEYYYTMPSIVMPILYGDGMKVKTAEAMMYGMTIFATDEALEGYSVDSVKGIYRCNSAEEFVDRIKKTYQKKENLSYNPEVRNYFLENNETEKQKTVLREIIF